jgi:hypothetical protein
LEQGIGYATLPRQCGDSSIAAYLTVAANVQKSRGTVTANRNSIGRNYYRSRGFRPYSHQPNNALVYDLNIEKNRATVGLDSSHLVQVLY